METGPEPVKAQKMPSGQPEPANTLSAKEADYKLTDLWGADPPEIYYEDDKCMIFAGCFGLFVYSKETEEIVQSLNLKEIGCDATQGDDFCQIYASEDGKTVYLCVVSDAEKMYQYSVKTMELQYLDYKLPDKLYNRKKWERANKSGIRLNGSTIGDLVYWHDDGGMLIKYEPLFYRPYGSCMSILLYYVSETERRGALAKSSRLRTVVQSISRAKLFMNIKKRQMNRSGNYLAFKIWIFFILGRLENDAAFTHVWLRALSDKLGKQDMEDLLKKIESMKQKLDRELAESVWEVSIRAKHHVHKN